MLKNDIRVNYFIFSICLMILGAWFSASVFGAITGFFLGYVLSFFYEYGKENN